MMVGEVSQSAIVYEKVEESVFVGWILQESNQWKNESQNQIW